MTADKPGSRHQRRSLCRCLGESLDRSNSTPPTGATSRSRPPRGAFLIPRPLAVVDYLAKSHGLSLLIFEELTGLSHSVIIHTMNAGQSKAPISNLLRRTIAESGVSYNALQKETGVTRASIMRFVRGDQSLRLDMADRLAVYFDLELRKRGRDHGKSLQENGHSPATARCRDR